jgi:PAS domain S-box-containing protein
MDDPTEAPPQNDSQYRELFDEAPVAYHEIDSGGIIRRVNRAECALFGREADEILGRPAWEFVAPAVQAEAADELRQKLAGLLPLASFHRRFSHRDGTPLWIEVHETPVRDPAGDIVGIRAALIDITATKRAEEALRASEERSQRIFENTLNAVTIHEIVLDGLGNPVDFIILNANPAFEKHSGLRVQDVLGRRVSELFAGVRKTDLIATCGKVVLTGKPAKFELYIEAAKRHFDITAFRTSGRQFAGVFEDITERKQAEEALRSSEARLRRAEVAGCFGHWEFDVAKGVIRGSEGARRIYGLDGNDWPAAVVQGMPLPVYRAALDEQLRQLVAGEGGYDIEFEIERPSDGQIVSVHSVASYDPASRTVFGIIQDVTERKRTEEHIREQAALLDVSGDAILLEDPDRTITYWNRGAEATYGWTADEAVGRKYPELLFRPDSSETESAWKDLLEKGVFAGERRHVTKDNRDIVVQVRASLMRDNAGRIKQALVVATDITEAKRLEGQYLRAQRLENLGSLASGIAHDLNNVLTPIMMAVDLLRPMARHPDDKETIRLLADSAQRGADIVRQLLLFGRGSEIARKALSVTDVLDEVRRMIRETFPRNLEFSLQAPKDLWRVVGDRTQIYQVFLNLCVNARDAMQHGGQLTVTAENVRVGEDFARENHGARPGPHVVVQVADTGIGIEPEIMDRIFDPFFTTKPEGQGSGLGLATVLGIVRNHGGFVNVESRKGLGSEFRVFIPADDTARNTEAIVASLDSLRGKGELVLLVEDEESLRQVQERSLKEQGYRTILAANGAEAVALFAQRAEHIQLIVTDVMMPVMDGLQVIHAIRRLRKEIPILAVSGLHSYRAEIQKLEDPNIHFLSKPFMADQLLAAMRRALDLSSSAEKGARKKSRR